MFLIILWLQTRIFSVAQRTLNATATPEQMETLNNYVANAAKTHFVDHGFQEGRKFYNRGGEVKGYQLGGGYTNPYGAERTGVRVDIMPPYDAFAPVPNDELVTDLSVPSVS